MFLRGVRVLCYRAAWMARLIPWKACRPARMCWHVTVQIGPDQVYWVGQFFDGFEQMLTQQEKPVEQKGYPQ